MAEVNEQPPVNGPPQPEKPEVGLALAFSTVELGLVSAAALEVTGRVLQAAYTVKDALHFYEFAGDVAAGTLAVSAVGGILLARKKYNQIKNR